MIPSTSSGDVGKNAPPGSECKKKSLRGAPQAQWFMKYRIPAVFEYRFSLGTYF